MGIEFNDLKEIKEIINENRNGITISEISELFSINRNTISKYLEILHLKGDLEIKESGNLKIYYPARRIPETVIKNYFHEPCIIINKKMEVEYANNAFLSLSNTKTEEITGKKIFSLNIPLFHNTELKENYKYAIDGEPVTKNIQTSFSEENYYMTVRLIPAIFEDRRKGFSLILNDQTRFKQEITSEQISEHRYREIVEDQTEYILRLLPDMTITFVNTAFCKYLGRKKEEVIGTKFDPVLSDDKIVSLENIFGGLSIENPSGFITMRSITYEGKINWLEWNIKGIFKNNSELIEYQGIGRNISKLKSAEEKLKVYKNNLEDLVEKRTIELQNVNKRLYDEILKQRETEKQLDNSLKKINTIRDEISAKDKKIDFILNTANLGMCDINYLKGEIEFNQKCVDILGYSAKEIPQTLEDWNKLIHPDDYRELLKKREDFIRGTTPHIHQSEYRVLCKNGNWKWISYTSTTTIRDNKAKLVSAIGLIEDISKRKNIENNINALLNLDQRLSESSSEAEAHSQCIKGILSILGMESAIYLKINRNNENIFVSDSVNADKKIINLFPLLKYSPPHEYITELKEPVIIKDKKTASQILNKLNNDYCNYDNEILSAIIIPVTDNYNIYAYYLIYSKNEICITEYNIKSLKLVIRNLLNCINNIIMKN
ncbi:PAS domain S-box protein [Methanoplanus limicola]|uniref:histidine kinase n=1 Tax=Methanoplanus limicola DSM 2279 TaxID=937775 RepID=H1YYQ1_9EURY|nr:PAS domain S-box protein [Methanoplanus limicola]EHQ36034.1 PAS sensor protein [Methanoplanus limicola DSM 2279]